jgi:Flp pilus assembly protein CpaB
MVRFNGWPRRLVAAACLLAALVSAVQAHRSPRHAAIGTAVVVAARDLAVGTTLTSADVQLSLWPSQLAPRHRLATTRSAVGRRLSSPLTGGEPVTLTRLVGSELTAGLDADHVACSVTTATDVGALIHPGDRIDLLAAAADDPLAVAPGAPARVIARDVQVLAVLSVARQDASEGTTLIVATTRTSALELAGIAASRLLAVLGRSP